MCDLKKSPTSRLKYPTSGTSPTQLKGTHVFQLILAPGLARLEAGHQNSSLQAWGDKQLFHLHGNKEKPPKSIIFQLINNKNPQIPSMGNSNFVWKCHFQMAYEKSHSDPALLTGKYLSPQNFHINPSLLSVALGTGSRAGEGKPGGTGSSSPAQQAGATASPSHIAANASRLLQPHSQARCSVFQRVHSKDLISFQN